ncbi:ABC transporter substrate-binding protein [Nitrosomonas aestuarii]|uniref:ABC transporter substrate-binding protein n=1 Tax=Nitrosomonas aestuarii TaxID=52441 RepID=UPI000D476649|nr:ABC transporter substrate-binding protein [Nitrosomonas aestuarii]PTN12207.1 phospholipid transport system substrate-binding protein [Nitrosomonas aestuarii]
MQRILILVSILMMSLAISLVSAANTDEPEPGSAHAVVHDLQQSLLQVMREGEQLDYSGRLASLTPVVDRTHDIEMIIKTILGATLWHELDQVQQDLIIETFRQLSIATYAGQFKQYSEEQFKFLEQRDLPRHQKLVRSQLIKGDGGIVNFDYVLHQPAEHWMIINILFDGVSDLAIKRSEYRSIIQREGFQSLIGMLKEKISEAEHTE